MRNQAVEWFREAYTRQRTIMFSYTPASGDAPGYHLRDLYERVSAAQQLGHTVEIVAKDGKLTIYYVAPFKDFPDWY